MDQNINDVEYYGHLVFNSISQNDFASLQSVLIIHPDALEFLDKFSNTPLLFACYCGRSQFVRYLLAHGANYKRINVFGKYSPANLQIILIFHLQLESEKEREINL